MEPHVAYKPPYPPRDIASNSICSRLRGDSWGRLSRLGDMVAVPKRLVGEATIAVRPGTVGYRTGTSSEVLAPHALALFIQVLARPTRRATVALFVGLELVALNAYDSRTFGLLGRSTGVSVTLLVTSWNSVTVYILGKLLFTLSE